LKRIVDPGVAPSSLPRFRFLATRRNAIAKKVDRLAGTFEISKDTSPWQGDSLEKRLTFKKPVDRNLVFDNFQPRRQVIHGGTGF
jgi:hypothetical protein